MSLQPVLSEIESYISFLFDGINDFEDGLIQIGGLYDKDAQSYSKDQIEKAVENVVRLNQLGKNCYATPSLLDPDIAPFGRCNDGDFYAAYHAWVDIDEDVVLDELREKYKECPPSRAIVTGRIPHLRVQLLFKFTEPVTDDETLREILIGLQQHFNGDSAVTNPTRLMRIGGTIAHPKKEGRVAEMTELHIPDHARKVHPDEILKHYPAKDLPRVDLSATINANFLNSYKSSEKISDGREDYMHRLLVAIIINQTRVHRAWPSLEQVFNEAWPIYSEKVLPRNGRSLDQDNRGEKAMIQKISSKLRMFQRGRVIGFETFEKITDTPDNPDDVDEGCQCCQLSVRKNIPKLKENVPLLTEDLIPPGIKERVLDISARMGIDNAMICLPLIAAISSVVGPQLSIKPKQKDDWEVVPNLWSATVSRAGTKKTPAMNEALGALYHLEKQSREEHEKKKLEVEDDTDLPACKRYVLNSASYQKVAEIAVNNQSMAVVRDELAGFIASQNKQSQEGSREFYLEAWNGNGSYADDTLSRGSIYIPNLCLSVIGSIQPKKLESLVIAPMKKGIGDDGLLQRFQLLYYPDDNGSYDYIDKSPDLEAKEKLYTFFEALSEIKRYVSHNFLNPYKKQYSINFDHEAQEFVDEYLRFNERRLREDQYNNSPSLASHLSKYNSLMPSLALIFELIEQFNTSTNPQISSVSKDSTLLAIDWCRFLEKHARKLYSFELKSELAPMHALAEKIERGYVYDGMTVRDLSRKCWKELNTSEAIDEAIYGLSEYGWLTHEIVKTSGGTSQIIRLHPDFQKNVSTDN